MSDGPVLWVTPEVPDRDGGGGNQRQAHLLIGLAELAPVDLLVAGRVRDPAVRAAARRIVEVDAMPATTSERRVVRRARAATTTWLARQPLDVASYAPVREALAEHIVPMAGDSASIVVHHQVLAPMLAAPRFTRARWAVHFFHAAGDRAEQLAAVSRHPLQRALLRRDGANARAVEQQAVDCAQALVVATPQDAERLSRARTPTYVVTQGVDIDRFTPSVLPTDPVVLFSGSLDYAPNVDGITWFAVAIWPAIRRRVPAARLVVVGRSPTSEVVALGDVDGITVHSDVPSMAPWLERARVAVAPLRVGTGVRVKVLEALAAGVPVVGTSVAFEGLALEPDDAAIVDDTGAFTDAVVALIADDALAASRRAAGRALVEERYTWKSSVRQLADALL